MIRESETGSPPHPLDVQRVEEERFVARQYAKPGSNRHRWLNCRRKARYIDLTAAEREALRLSQVNVGKRPGEPPVAYNCMYCNGYHVGYSIPWMDYNS